MTIGPPSPWVVRFAPQVAAGGTCLDLAAGSGRHARHLLALGHGLVALDRDVAGMTDLIAHPNAEIIAADLETSAPWPLGGRTFAGVVVTNYLHRPVLPRIIGCVGPGGVLIYETFAQGNERHGRPRNPDFLLCPGELPALAEDAGLHVVAFEQGLEEDDGGARVVQRICAVRDSGPRRLTAL